MYIKTLWIVSLTACRCLVCECEYTLSVSRSPHISYGNSSSETPMEGSSRTRERLVDIWFPMNESSWRLIDAIISIEDRRFREHEGIDLQAKIAGIRANIIAGKIIRGSSTLTQQYIKNAYYRWSDRTIRQKIREAIGALWIEKRENKSKILRAYLDHIYFGNRIYGLQTAIDIYFPTKDITTLTDDDLDIITRIHSPNISTTDIESVRTYRNSIVTGSDGPLVRPSSEMRSLLGTQLISFLSSLSVYKMWSVHIAVERKRTRKVDKRYTTGPLHHEQKRTQTHNRYRTPEIQWRSHRKDHNTNPRGKCHWWCCLYIQSVQQKDTCLRGK